MKRRVAGFEWDEGNWPKCGRHGVSRAEIESVIAAARFVVDDPSPNEKRYRTAGRAQTDRHVFVVFNLPGTRRVRIRPTGQRPLYAQEGD
jgi:uncharacterized DUF497 family protein